MKPSKRKRRIQAIKARLKEYYHLKEMNNYFKRNFIELTRHPAFGELPPATAPKTGLAPTVKFFLPVPFI